jgi:hypothetical protein
MGRRTEKPVEIGSALARFMRMKQLDFRDWAKASKLAKSLVDSWSVIQLSDALRATSIQLADRYDSSWMSAWHLAQRVIRFSAESSPAWLRNALW